MIRVEYIATLSLALCVIKHGVYYYQVPLEYVVQTSQGYYCHKAALTLDRRV